jgi:hypothetical protein
MTRTKVTAATVIGLTIFVLIVVGGPYSYLIFRACEPTGLGDFFTSFAEFHTREGCR